MNNLAYYFRNKVTSRYEKSREIYWLSVFTFTRHNHEINKKKRDCFVLSAT